MKSMLKKFWNDEAGFVVTVEMILVATVVVIGIVAGLTVVRDAILAELQDTANAINAVNQSYGIAGATVAGADADTPIAKNGNTVFNDAVEGETVPTTQGVVVSYSTVTVDGVDFTGVAP